VAALFRPSANRAARLALVALVALPVAAVAFGMAWARTPVARGKYVHVVQPVPFDHRLHVTGLRIDCRYCHAGAERTALAGLPSTEKCTVCHTQLVLSTPQFSAVRRSLQTGRPIPWRRVTELPAFVYFDHAMHVENGVGCETCHGRVDRMAEVRQEASLTMGWCVDCHRNPAPHLRPVEAVTAMGWSPPASGDSLGAALAARYHVRRLTNCTTCHR
jgi:hypothetical protein